MKWIKLKQAIFPEFIKFVIQYEWKSISFSSRIITPEGTIKTLNEIEDSIYCCIDEDDLHILGTILTTRTGLLLPILGDSPVDENGMGLEDIKNLFRKKKKIFCILGYEDDVIKMLKIFNPRIDTELEYYLLSSNRYRILKNDGEQKLLINRAHLKDAARLYPMEEKYIMDEVIVHKDMFSKSAALLNLKRICTNHILLYIERNKVPVSKANTNAIGINYVQIGGVFTDYSYRQKGYSFILMNRLMQEIYRLKKQSILFVKKNNLPANLLYKKLGFKRIGNYRIVYIKH